jgi:hypothetical protein
MRIMKSIPKSSYLSKVADVTNSCDSCHREEKKTGMQTAASLLVYRYSSMAGWVQEPSHPG